MYYYDEDNEAKASKPMREEADSTHGILLIFHEIALDFF